MYFGSCESSPGILPEVPPWSISEIHREFFPPVSPGNLPKVSLEIFTRVVPEIVSDCFNSFGNQSRCYYEGSPGNSFADSSRSSSGTFHWEFCRPKISPEVLSGFFFYEGSPWIFPWVVPESQSEVPLETNIKILSTLVSEMTSRTLPEVPPGILVEVPRETVS